MKAHHWLLPEPDGQIALGVCKFCTATREHKNSQEYTAWYGFNKKKVVNKNGSSETDHPRTIPGGYGTRGRQNNKIG